MSTPLPLDILNDRAPVSEAHDLVATPDVPGGGLDTVPHLLVVDDEEGPRESLRLVFKEDYRITVASSAKMALELAREHQIDVAILDIRMPDMTGLELLEHIRQLDPGIEVVMLTAFETPEYLRKALRLRACDYLNKPFEVQNIRTVITAAMRRRLSNREVQDNIQRLAEIREQVQQLRVKEETMRTRWEIYASIIHDINGPLTIISGLVQLVNQRLNQEAALYAEDLELMKDRMRRVTRQVTNCIEISRRYLKLLSPNSGETGKVWANHILVDLGDLVRALPDARGHELQIKPLPKDALVLVNGTDLIQMLLNLTINALQCARECHLVEVRGEVIMKPLDLALFQDGPNERFINREGFQNLTPLLSLSVMDTGPGMTPDVLERIFEPFVGQHSLGERRSGLGLCIVRRLLKENRGGLHVHAEPGRGTVCTLYLPARLASAAGH
ncbi:MAG: response regulator [Verrucomicrobia bacterium]|nr:response regulator [Verrucomicrobiota bacterium]MBI3868514.1 response regulator [Verrucomicrobiota bacterium]